MTDQTIPDVTDDDRKLAREWAEGIAHDMDNWGDGIRTVARVVLDAVPAPPRPTMADMSPVERHACRWMQADTETWGRVVIVCPITVGGDVILLDRCGDVIHEAPAKITPRPDLPRLEWPGDEKPTPAPDLPDGWRLADHPDLGRVIVTTQTPNSNGRVYAVRPDAGNFMGYDWHFCDPNDLTYLDQEADQ